MILDLKVEEIREKLNQLPRIAKPGYIPHFYALTRYKGAVVHVRPIWNVYGQDRRREGYEITMWARFERGGLSKITSRTVPCLEETPIEQALETLFQYMEGLCVHLKIDSERSGPFNEVKWTCKNCGKSGVVDSSG